MQRYHYLFYIVTIQSIFHQGIAKLFFLLWNIFNRSIANQAAAKERASEVSNPSAAPTEWPTTMTACSNLPPAKTKTEKKLRKLPKENVNKVSGLRTILYILEQILFLLHFIIVQVWSIDVYLINSETPVSTFPSFLQRKKFKSRRIST